MGKIRNGILGPMTGKLGGVVGRTWKGLNTLASYQPNVSNPRTSLQVAQRTKMKTITQLASELNTLFIKPLWDRFAKNMSGYNAFIQANVSKVNEEGRIDYENLVFSQGKMSAVEIELESNGNDFIKIKWNTDLPDAFSLATDKAYIAILDRKGKLWAYSAGTIQRSAGSANIEFPYRDSYEVNIYLAFRRVDGTIVSNSSYMYVEI